MPGARFADSLVAILDDPHQHHYTTFMRNLAETVEDYLTKRILVEAPQWEAFFSANPLPKEVLQQLHWPFDDTIYIEPTQPILPASLTKSPQALREAVQRDGYDPDTEQTWIRALLVLPTDDTNRTLCTISTMGHQVLCNIMQVNLRTGRATSDMHTDDPNLQQYLEPDNLDQSLQYFANATTMLVAYLNAKGISLEPEPLPRQQRRLLERKGIPNPWYVIRATHPRAEPGLKTGTGTAHGHRYDVIGHMRIGRHPLADGTHRLTPEWVPPHQRGIRHTRYIPATRRFSGERSPQEHTEPKN